MTAFQNLADRYGRIFRKPNGTKLLMDHLTCCWICGITLPEQSKICGMYSTMLYKSVARIFPWRGKWRGGGVRSDCFYREIFTSSKQTEACNYTSECYMLR